MVSVADISFPQTSLSQKTNIDITAYQADLVYYVRKRPSRKMRVIKDFLDENLRDPNQHIEGIDRDLSYLYAKFCEEQNARRKLNKLNMLNLRPKSTSKKKKKTLTEASQFKEYSEYLEQFADKDCNLLQEVKPKPGANAEIFKKVLLKHKGATFSQREPKHEIQEIVQEIEPSIVNDISLSSIEKKPSQPERISPLKPNRSLTVTITGGKPQSQRMDSNNHVSPLLKRPQSVGLNARRMNSLPVNAKYSTRERENKSSEKITTTNVSNVALLKNQKVKKPIISIEEKTIAELKNKINKHLISQRSCKKDIPFQFDKNFLASRRIQKKQQDFAVRTGLIQAKVNMSFGL